MKFSVLGCGRWGSFISWYLCSKKGYDVCLYGRESSKAFQLLKNTRKNEYVSLDEKILLTNELEKAVDFADIIIISISAQNLREFVRDLVANYHLKDKKIILCMKGLETPSGKRLTQVCIEEGIDKNNIAVWLGPGHIQDFTNGIPNCMTIDSYNKELTYFLADNLASDLIRFYYGDDIIGNEIGAACKNIMGICAGALDGLGFGAMKGPLMVRGAFEVSKFITAMGGDGYTAYGLTHLGDYETTLFSKYSNNRNFGEKLALGLPFDKLAEGVKTSEAVYKKAQQMGVDMPITEAVYKVLFENADLKAAISSLFNRSVKTEKYSWFLNAKNFPSLLK